MAHASKVNLVSRACHGCMQVNGPKPLPTFESRVDEAGNIEVMI
jgi:hypothetical protein